MMEFSVDGLQFEFPSDWSVAQYDEWSFYRNQFCKVRDGVKAVDLIAIDHQKTAWMIEVKDYRRSKRTKPLGIGEEIAQKVFDTLAALLPAAINANDDDERQTAKAIIGAKRIRIVLHLEQPKHPSTLFPRAFDPSVVALKLKTLLKSIDAHPIVTEMKEMRGVAWKVS